jgi:hypothetical protein
MKAERNKGKAKWGKGSVGSCIIQHCTPNTKYNPQQIVRKNNTFQQLIGIVCYGFSKLKSFKEQERHRHLRLCKPYHI